MIENKKTKNNLIKLIYLTILLIASIIAMITASVFAADIEIDELANITDLVGALEKRYTAIYIIKESNFKAYFDDRSYTALSTNHAIYCVAHGKALFDQHSRCTFKTDHNGSYDMDNYISFQYGGTPSPSTQKFDDHMQAGESDTRGTSSNIRYKITPTDLRNISTNYGTFTGNIIPYAATFEDSNTPYVNPGQNAIWGRTGANGDMACFNDLYKAGYSVDALESEIAVHGDQPKVTVEKRDDNTGCGTTYENGNYVVGPFKMSDYAYVGSQFAKLYSGKDLAVQKDLVGGIESGYITLNNGVKLEFGKEVSIRYTNHGNDNRSYSGSATSAWFDAAGNQYIILNDNDNHERIGDREVQIIYENDKYVIKWLDDGSTTEVTLQQTGDTVEYWGVPKNYTCPFPNSEFYIVFPRSATGNATTLSSFSFKYRKTRAEGSGWVANGEYVRTTFNRTDITQGCTKYSTTCNQQPYGNSTSFSIYENKGGDLSRSHTHYYKCKDHDEGCGCSGHKTCGMSSHTHTASCAEKGCSKTEHSHDSSCYTYYDLCDKCCSGHYYTCTATNHFECEHGHTECKSCNWQATSTVEYPQPLIGIEEAHVDVTSEDYTYTVDVRLTTDLQINKYIIKVEHVGESGVIFGENSSRSRASSASNTYEWKKQNPVKVERGDLVTYKIDIINSQNQDVSFQIKDILPSKCADSTFNPSINQWLEVKGNQTYTVVVTLRPTADTGVWENYSEIITKNSGNVDYNRTDYAESDKRHNGPVVNVAELDGGIINDSDFYQIKEYNVNIEKYIYDVNHVPDNVAPSKLDTSIAIKDEGIVDYTTIIGEDERSVVNGMTEATKQANPVYAEYGDTVTYKIKIYNTTSQYNGSINRNNAPYWNPDKVYVNIEDTLPNKYKDLKITVSNGTGAINTSSGKFTITNLMVPPDGVTTVTVTLVVDEHTKGTVETNSVKFIGSMRNINKGPGNGNNVDDKYCVIKNNPITTETKDYYKLNNYNAFIDKYVYEYDEKIQKENNDSTLTSEDLITNDDGTLKTSRRNDSTQTSTISDGNVNDTVREPNGKDEYKENHPVSVEKDENLVYHIKVSNEATTVNKSVPSGTKPATQVRTTKVTDKMQLGLQQKRVTAKMYNADGTICNRYAADGSVTVNVSSPVLITENGRQYNQYEYTIGNDTILNPGEYIIYSVEVLITGTDMYLYNLENTATLTILTNINNVRDPYQVQTPSYTENISKQQETTEYVRMKDLVIAGKVWLDFNKNGLMDDTITDYVGQTKDESLYRKDPSKLSTYYSINENAMMKDIVVKLYRSDGTLIRTTKTDANGLFTFGRDDGLRWYESGYNHDKQYSSTTTYQRIDKADGKDENGNYTANSKYISYYVEYEYDGVVYKATAYSGKDHLNDDGSYNGAECNHSFETNTSGYATDNYTKETAPTEKYKYEYDSNANEFVSVRENFNTKYEYITYNQAYSITGTTESGSTLDFDKTDHTSQLLVDHNRKMTARSFIEEITQPNAQEATNYIPLFGYNSSNVNVPYSRYLKFINLGLELREDVDISLTKDVYKVKTTIKGEEMEYNFNTNFRINGDVLDETALNNYKFDHPYGIELYESDYKFRNEQYSSIKAVQDYLGEESELNVEVTYRIRVDNNKVHKDGDLNDPESLNSSYDKKNFEDTEKTNLYVKVDEILDLYDENFMEYTPEMENGSKEDYILSRELDPYTGRFAKEDEKIKIAEAWYYKPSDNGNYILDDATKIYVDTTEENITIPEGAQRYARVELKVSNNSIKPSTNEYIDSQKYNDDGYHKLYISGDIKDEKIAEGDHLDIFVKYVLDKGNEEITVTNDSWEETMTEASSSLYSEASYDAKTGKGSWSWSSSSTETTTTNRTTNMIRSLIIKEKTETEYKKAYGLATENIAQVNLYSVWYAESDKPASLVDKDSNVGNVGIDNDKKVNSADNKKIYEDTIYKTGINITALGTSNIPGQITETVTELDGGSGNFTRDIRRIITGHVWDDSRSENAGDPTQYIGNGLRLLESDNAIEDAKKNELVPIVKNNPKLTEEKDIPVSSAKVEFIEIVETDANKYYELTPTDVSCDYRQHVRTAADGTYELYGYTPGKYVIRFTYGDDVEASRESGIVEQTADGTQASQEDMYLFNGQDYKSTQYTMPDLTTGVTEDGKTKYSVLDDNVVLYNDTNKTDAKEIVDANNEKIDKVIASLEAENYNDARDDEIRRLETNSYSEVMDNMVAEILQGMANGKQKENGEYLTNNSDANTDQELKALVGNTWMFAETVPFTVRAEKINDALKAKVTPIVNDPTYANREQLETQLTHVRDFKIENVDFGIEYRPENSVQLEKEIKEVKITTESGETVVDLHFYTEYEPINESTADGKTSLKTHYLDREKSVGLDMIQFISNEYEVNDLVSGLISEKEDAFQGFVYINYDVDIQQGATVEITYEFIAENHGEVDRIAKNLDDIRYQKNFATQGKAGSVINNLITGNANQNGITNYKANITAANDMINNLYAYDDYSKVFYRTSPKVLTTTDGSRTPEEKVDAKGASRNKLSYYGYYSGYGYYTGDMASEEAKKFDTVAELKFNKILDYVDKDMLYLDNTTGAETLDKNWSILDNTYKEYYSTIDWARSDPEYVASVAGDTYTSDDVVLYVNNKIKGLDIKSAYKVIENTDGLNSSQESNNLDVGGIAGASIDPDGYIYDNMLLSTDTGMYTDRYTDENRTLPESPTPGTNPSLSRFLIPMVADSAEDDYSQSRGKIDLTISKAISAETGDDELEYENIAEIVEFTTLTGRRTNFAITIGNVDVRMDKNKENLRDPEEYPQAVPEPDQAAAEVVTLIPPQGLMKRDRVIKDVVEIAKTGTSIVVIIVAVVAIGVFVTMFAIRKYNKRRIK